MDITNIVFGIGRTKSISLFHIDLLSGTIEFHIINIEIPFLLLFKDMNKFDIYYNNIIDIVIVNKIRRSFLYIH